MIVDPESSSRCAVPLARRLAHPAHLVRRLVEAERLGVAHHRDHQPDRRLGRDRRDAPRRNWVRRSLSSSKCALTCGKSATALTIASIRNGSSVSLGRSSVARRVQRRAQILERGDVDLLDIGEMGDAARGLRHVLGDAAAHADDPDRLDRHVGLAARPLRRRLGRMGDEGVEVVVGDAARGPRPAHEAQVDAGFARPEAHRGRGERLFAGRARGAARRRRATRGRGGGASLRSASSLASGAGSGDPRAPPKGALPAWRAPPQRPSPRPSAAGRGLSSAGPARRCGPAPSRPASTSPTAPPSATTVPATGVGISTVALSVMTATTA